MIIITQLLKPHFMFKINVATVLCTLYTQILQKIFIAQIFSKIIFVSSGPQICKKLPLIIDFVGFSLSEPLLALGTSGGQHSLVARGGEGLAWRRRLLGRWRSSSHLLVELLLGGRPGPELRSPQLLQMKLLSLLY